MSNILFLTHIYPFPPDDGGRIVTYNTLSILEKRNHNVFLVSFYDPKKEREAKIGRIKQFLVSKNYDNNNIRLLRNFFQKLPYTMEKYLDKDIEAIISKILDEEEIDIVILDHLHMAYYAKLIKKINPKISVYLRQHNIESVIMKRAYKEEANLLKRLYLLLQYKKLYKYESNICRLMDGVFVITEEDKRTLKQMNASIEKIDVVKAGVDFKRYYPIEPQIKNSNQNYNLVFLGAMNWLPNENGVIWFLENVFQELINDVKGIKFYIVGKNPSEKIRNYEKAYPENIEVTGYVEDERKYIAMADVFIVPLLIGGGMRLKILNALAMKKAVVSTNIGAEGINLKNSYSIADSPEEFKNNIKKILLNDQYRYSLEENGYNQVKKYYSFESVLEPLLYRISKK